MSPFLPDYKHKLVELSTLVCAGDRLLFIFSHGDDEPNENGRRMGILVGEGTQDGFGVFYATKLDSMLEGCLA